MKSVASDSWNFQHVPFHAGHRPDSSNYCTPANSSDPNSPKRQISSVIWGFLYKQKRIWQTGAELEGSGCVICDNDFPSAHWKNPGLHGSTRVSMYKKKKPKKRCFMKTYTNTQLYTSIFHFFTKYSRFWWSYKYNSALREAVQLSQYCSDFFAAVHVSSLCLSDHFLTLRLFFPPHDHIYSIATKIHSLIAGVLTSIHTVRKSYSIHVCVVIWNIYFGSNHSDIKMFRI